MKIKVEVVVDSVESAVAAQQGGAYRLEACIDLGEGGLFPGYGLISDIREHVSIPLHVMIRPRPGNFFYSQTEFLMMIDQILIAREAGADGIVVGMLNQNGTVDGRIAELIAMSSPLSVTFHRAFDEAREPLNALEAVVAAGAHRLLTSGQARSAWDGRELIRQLVERSAGRTGILAGAGITASNAADLIDATGVREIHVGRGVRNADDVVDAVLVRRMIGPGHTR